MLAFSVGWVLLPPATNEFSRQAPPLRGERNVLDDCERTALTPQSRDAIKRLDRLGARSYRLPQVVKGTPLTTYTYEPRTASERLSYKIAFTADGIVGEVILRVAD